MIKIIMTEKCKSFWRDNDAWNLERTDQLKIYFCGIKVWDRKITFNREPVKDEFNGKLGFKLG